ncbi:MAG: hypothetical protein ACI82Q_001413 [Nonlabens sp.]|jgi:hypothetical protein
MAAKQKSDASQDNDKPKKPVRKTPVKKTTAAKSKATKATKKSTAKKPVARKTPPKKQIPVVPEDDLGLDDISLESSDDSVIPLREGKKKPEPKKEKPVAAPKQKAVAAKTAPVKEAAKSEIKEAPQPVNVEEKKKGGINPFVIVIVLLALSAAAYFLFFKKQEAPEPAAPIEENIDQPAVEQTPAPKVVEVQPEPVVTVELTTISAPTTRYYVVIGSFYDEDLAIDKGNEIVANGTSAFIIQPTGGFKLHRVGINASNAWSDAASKLDGLKSKYGDNIWVLKY